MRWGSLRTQLTVLSFAITLVAILAVLFYVTPQLESSLRDQKMKALSETARAFTPQITKLVRNNGNDEEIDKVVGLEIGADDYITKPFSMREFRSRVKAALRRADMQPHDSTPTGDGPLEVAGLRIDFDKRAVRVRDTPVQTTFVEFEILAALANAPGRVFTREMLLTRIWGDAAYRDPRTIDVHIRHLREKLELDAKQPEYLFTVRGVGYRFRDTEPDA